MPSFARGAVRPRAAVRPCSPATAYLCGSRGRDSAATRARRPRTAAQGDGRAAAARRDGARRLTVTARGETATRRRPVAARGACAARRPHAARPLPSETAAWRDGRASMKEAAAAAFGGGLSPNSHGETAARRMRGSSARRRGEMAMRRGGETAACRMSKHLRGETAARRLYGERECLVSRAVAARAVATRRDGRHGETAARRAVAARRDGRTARWPRGLRRLSHRGPRRSVEVPVSAAGVGVSQTPGIENQ
jgi:hypothetical protein